MQWDDRQRNDTVTAAGTRARRRTSSTRPQEHQSNTNQLRRLSVRHGRQKPLQVTLPLSPKIPCMLRRLVGCMRVTCSARPQHVCLRAEVIVCEQAMGADRMSNDRRDASACAGRVGSAHVWVCPSSDPVPRNGSSPHSLTSLAQFRRLHIARPRPRRWPPGSPVNM